MQTAQHLLRFIPSVRALRRHASFAHGAARHQVLRHNILLLIYSIAFIIFFTGGSSVAVAKLVVIGNESLGSIEQLDRSMLGRIYTGRTVQIDRTPVHPVNMKIDDDARAIFLRETLNQNNNEYVAYWIVRRAIGKGAPPAEMRSVQEMIDHVRSTPGAIGYIEASRLLPGVKVLLTFP